MSIYFATEGERELWNPSSLTGRIFHAQAESVARLMGVESGLGAIVSDEVVVNEEAFKSFAESFAEFVVRTDPHSGARTLLEGCFSLVGALALKVGVTLPEEPELARLIEHGCGLVQ